ncbi:hypothetical protein ACJMK2_036937 [Sinanodonta woodiana]|uniref:Uncharacterized protein n=1 Tax=Sinanodonta woodiana TaxID=1069815 RepID=A0ABD3WMA5_SINWO
MEELEDGAPEMKASSHFYEKGPSHQPLCKTNLEPDTYGNEWKRNTSADGIKPHRLSTHAFMTGKGPPTSSLDHCSTAFWGWTFQSKFDIGGIAFNRVIWPSITLLQNPEATLDILPSG